MFDLQLVDLAFVPVVVGLVEVVKRTFDIPSKYLPASSLGIGILIAALASQGIDLQAVLSGVVLGLTASGLYSGGKATIKN